VHDIKKRTKHEIICFLNLFSPPDYLTPKDELSGPELVEGSAAAGVSPFLVSCIFAAI
jgi:hypothetical protein